MSQANDANTKKCPIVNQMQNFGGDSVKEVEKKHYHHQGNF